jgi:hypothetical protein
MSDILNGKPVRTQYLVLVVHRHMLFVTTYKVHHTYSYYAVDSTKNKAVSFLLIHLVIIACSIDDFGFVI